MDNPVKSSVNLLFSDFSEKPHPKTRHAIGSHGISHRSGKVCGGGGTLVRKILYVYFKKIMYYFILNLIFKKQ